MRTFGGHGQACSFGGSWEGLMDVLWTTKKVYGVFVGNYGLWVFEKGLSEAGVGKFGGCVAGLWGFGGTWVGFTSIHDT